ncbi:hypothetical protein LTR62_003265 [Meristemomyces frigidus]|uniref:Uncharacterized protein n=1 Tax=Meristemomyces frigidus TaxID=1508187 RepID=A0AAN7TGB6_9PEZI|nr:hypothetical protein LTR62_003265 [Meristemomyces frigidus]
MSSQQPNVWQTAGRPRNSQPASRTPQNRSGTASPSQQNQPSQPPRQQEGGRPQQPNNVWTQRSNNTSGSNGQVRNEGSPVTRQEDAHVPAHGFNAAEVRAVLSKQAGGMTTYKIKDDQGPEGSGGNMGNGQPFLPQLAKQIATLQEGG